MRSRRTIASIALALWGAFALLGAVPQVEAALRSLLESGYRVTPEPFDLRAALFGTAFLVSGVGSLLERRWALWLASASLLAEIPFGTRAGAWGLLRGVQDAGSATAPAVPTLFYFVLAFFLVGFITALLVWLLRPWAHSSMARGQAR